MSVWDVFSGMMRFLEDNMNVEKFVYTLGHGYQRFFEGLKEGRIVASRCGECGITYLPPRIYCEECLSEINDFVEIKQNGVVLGYTIQNINKNGVELEEKVTWALIGFNGVRGGIFHRLAEVEPDEIYIGMPVKPVFKKDRKGSIKDIEYFKPIE